MDSFQGREDDIIIVDFVRTDSIGFLKNEKRINVAISRARKYLYMFGNVELLRKYGITQKLVNYLQRNRLIKF